MTEEAPQRQYSLRKVSNALRWIVRSGAPWRFLPADITPWRVVYEQTQRWIRAAVFEAMVRDVRELMRVTGGKKG
jgi:transposase